jgi:hypothetical protein
MIKQLKKSNLPKINFIYSLLHKKNRFTTKNITLYRGVIFSTIPNHNPFYVLFRFLLIDHHNKITKNEKINF